MKYDDAEYQYLAFTNPETPMEWGGRYIAMYFAWALSRGLGAEDMAEAAAEIAGGRSPVDVLFDYGDGKLLDEFFNAEGDAFTAAYYEAHFYDDIDVVFDRDGADTGHPADDALSVADTPENLARLSARLDQRFRAWKADALTPTADEALAVVDAQIRERHTERAERAGPPQSAGQQAAFPQGTTREWAPEDASASAPRGEPMSPEVDEPLGFFARLLRALSLLFRL